MKPLLPLLTAALLTTSLLPFAQAQTQPAKPNPNMTTTKITISAKALAQPDLDYALLPKMEDTEPGNAVLHYYIALQLLSKPGPNQTALDDIPDYYDTIDKQLHDTPLAQLDEKLVQKIVDDARSSLHELDMGSLLESADWQPGIRKDGFKTLLPYLGELRHLSNILALSIRLDIKNHRWQAAHQKLQTGYALAQHLNSGLTLIDSLVGIAIASNMNKCLEDWIAEPNSPNLYWPIANLPHPFNDLQKPLAFERADVYISIPEMRAMREPNFSPDQWISFVNHFRPLLSNATDWTPGNPAPSSFLRDSAGALSAALLYPSAKQFLIDRGMSAADVEKLPVSVVLGKYFDRSYSEAGDSVFKYLAIPIYQSLDKPDEVAEHLKLQKDANILAKIFIPSLGRARFLAVRLDRDIAMLTIIEALRAYADANHALPDSLDALTLPVPLDPLTNQPFQYLHDGKTATLISPTIRRPNYNGATFEITLTP